jgi:DEAD/DEAH box helicase domain-containing protein
VIDEAHRYRGIFGSHIALLVRRLVRLCRHHGSDPQFILSTATLANPLDFAERLTGKKFELVDNDGAPHGRKHFLLYNPYYDGLGDRSMHQETKDFLLSCVSGNLQTLCFTGSRKMAELITLRAREDFPGAAKDRTDAIVAYRAGYLPEERRGIEQDIRNGIIRGIVSTNALELGIDIGSLDAVILSGYPGTMMSTWQQAGRAGRSGSDSLAILVAQSNPLDQYFIHHPEQFFSRSHEHAIIDTQNPYVLSGHLLCAASEIPVDEVRDTEFFGGSILSFLHEFASGDIVRKTGRGWVYSGRGRAADLVRLDGIPGETFRILCHGKVLETMGRAQAYREAHPGAILLHQGETYCAGEMDLATHTIRVAPANVDYYTQALKEVRLDIVSTHLEKEVHGARAYFGEVEVTERYTGYKIKRGDTIIGVEPLTLPPIRFRTKAFWIVPMASTEQKVMSASYDLAGGLHGVEHALIAIMPLHVVCDRWDLGGLSSPAYGEEGSPVIFVYDGFEGGIGLSEKAFVLLPEILATTYELVRDCQCTDGCPSCIQSPKCGNDNHPLDKNAAEMILGDLAMEKNTEAPNNARIHELAAS